MAKKENIMVKVGLWAFTVGAFLALAAGFIAYKFPSTAGPSIAVLALLGIIVGFLNVTEEETPKFLMGSVSIMIALFTAGAAIKGNIAALGSIGSYMLSILENINIFVFPATIVVAVKSLYALAKD